MKKIVLLLGLFVFATALQAGPRFTWRGKITVPPTASIEAARVPAAGLSAQLEQQVARQVLVQQTAARNALIKNKRPLWQQVKRNFQAAQLKKQRRLRDAQARNLLEQQQRRTHIEAALPKPNFQKTFTATDFETLLPAQAPAQPLPLAQLPGVLYRGMALAADGNALKNILQNGLLVADVGPEATTLGMVFAGGKRVSMQAVANYRVTNFTSLPHRAAFWAHKRKKDAKPLEVIVGVEGQTKTGEVVTVGTDIAAQQIVYLVAPLQVDGKATWCHVSLSPQGTFLISPYTE